MVRNIKFLTREGIIKLKHPKRYWHGILFLTFILFVLENTSFTQTKSKLSILTKLSPGTMSLDFISKAKPQVVNLEGNGLSNNYPSLIKQISPNTIIIGRVIVPGLEYYVPGSQIDYKTDAIAKAQLWWEQAKTTILANPVVDYWIGYQDPGGPTEVSYNSTMMSWYCELEIKRMEILISNGKKACIGNFGGGRPELLGPPECSVCQGNMYPYFYPAIDKAMTNGHIMGVEEYGKPLQKWFEETTGEGWMVGRYRTAYRRTLIPAGKKIPLVITRICVDWPGGDYERGWKPTYTWQEYAEQLKWLDTKLKEDDYVLGATIFGLDMEGMYGAQEIGTDINNNSFPEFANWLTTYVVASATLDTTPPPTPTAPIDDGTFTISTNELHFRWTKVTDMGSEILRYYLSIGSTPNGTDVLNNKDVGNVAEYFATSLTLTTGTTYYARVKAESSGGQSAYSTSSDGIVCLQLSEPGNLHINKINSVPTYVTSGNNSTILVSMTVDNNGYSDIWIDSVGLSFKNSTTDVGQYFTVTPSGSNPTRVPRNTLGTTFTFSVNVAGNTPAGTTVINGNIQGWENLVPNGSFEDGTSIPPTNWYTWSSDTKTGTFVYDTGDKTHGNRSLKINYSNLNAGDGDWMTATVNKDWMIPVSPSTGYTLSVKYKDNVWVNVDRVLAFEEYDAIGNLIKPAQRSLLSHNDNWFSTSTFYTTNANTVLSRVWVGLHTRGKLEAVIWFDECIMKKTSAGTVQDNTANSPASLIIGTGDSTAPTTPGTPQDDGEYTASATSLHFIWTAASDSESGIAKYLLSISNTPGGTNVLNDQDIGNNTEYTATGLSLTVGTTYYAKVKAQNGVGLSSLYSGNSNGIYVIIPSETISPSAVADLSATPGTISGAVQLRWTAPGDDNNIGTATQYDIRYRTNASINTSNWDSATQLTNEPTPQSAGTVQTWTVNGLSLGTSYYFALKTADEIPNWSGISNSAVVYLLAAQDTTAPTVPGTPEDDGDTTTSTIQLHFKWTAATDPESSVTKYFLCIGNTLGGTNVLLDKDVGLVTDYTVTGLSLTVGQTYYAKVKAQNSVGLTGSYSGNSNGILVTAGPDTTPPTAPGTPIDDGVSTTVTDRLHFAWSSSIDTESGVSKYFLCIGNIPGGTNVVNDLDVGTQTEYTITELSLTLGTTYYAKVKAQNSIGLTSTYSNNSDGIVVVSGVDTTPPTKPGTPRDDGETTASTTQLHFTWDAAVDIESGIDRYYITIGNVPDGANVIIDKDVGNVTDYTVTGLSLTVGQTYYAKVKAQNKINMVGTYSASSDGIRVVSTQDTIPPNAVADLSAQSGLVAGDVNLRWNSPGDDGNTGTLITGSQIAIQYLTTNGPWSRITAQVYISIANVSPGTVSTYQFNNLSSVLTYYFCIWTADEVGNWSGESNKPYIVSTDITVPPVKKEAKPEQKFVTGTVEATFGTDAEQVNIYDPAGGLVIDLNQTEFGGSQIRWGGIDEKGKRIESGAYVYKIKKTNKKIVYGIIIVAK